MKKRELEKYRKKTKEDLTKDISELEKKRDQAMINLTAGKETNLKTVKNLRRDIAQLKSIQNQIKK